MPSRDAIPYGPLIKTAIFSLVVPGTVGLLVPYYLRNSSRQHMFSLPLQAMLGGFLMAIGVYVYLWCAWDFAVKGIGTPAPMDAPSKLVVQGLYRRTRNPMYVGVSAMVLGQAMYHGSTAIAIYWVGFFVLVNLFVRFYEEPALRKRFGAQYTEYCKRVPRWFLSFRRA